MKSIYLSACFLACLLLAGNCLQAQQDQQSTQHDVIIIQKSSDDDGTVTIKKKRIVSGQSVEDYMESLDLENAGKKVEITIVSDDQAPEGENKERIFFFRSGDDQQIEINVNRDVEEAMKDFDFDFDFDYDYDFDSDEANTHRVQGNKALLGVYPSSGETGVALTGIVSGSGAEKAGLLRDDVMTAINGERISTNDDLRSELAKYLPGDMVIVDYLRDGQAATVGVTLTKKKSHSYNYNYRSVERDPCKVFYGVYVGSYGHGKQGVGVNGIISGWPAESAGLQAGDRITAIDGIPVNTHHELVTERDRHEPGEFFTFTYLREGEEYDVEAQFRECPKDQEVQPEEPVEESLPEVEEELEFTDNMLLLEEFSAYPNPTVDNLNVEFRGEAVPTMVRIVDINGKILHEENLLNFDGYYNRRIDVTGGAPGTLMLSVMQNGTIQTKPVILLARA